MEVGLGVEIRRGPGYSKTEADLQRPFICNVTTAVIASHYSVKAGSSRATPD